MSDTCVPSLIVIGTAINQLETNVLLIPMYCLRLFVVYKHVMLYIASEVMVSDTCVPSLIVIGTAINKLESKVLLKTIYFLRLFVVVYKHVTL